MNRLILIIIAMMFVLPSVVFAQTDGFHVGTIEVTGQVVESVDWEPREIGFGDLDPGELKCRTVFIDNVGGHEAGARVTLRTTDTEVDWSVDDDVLWLDPGERDEVEVCVFVPGDVPA